MKKISIKIFPLFIKKIDNYLLLNYPVLWSSRIHKLLFLCAFVVAFMVLLIKITPLSFTSVMFNHIFINSLSVCLGVLLLVYWLYSQALFNFGANFGKMRNDHHIKITFLFLIAFFSIFSTIVIPNWYFNTSIQEKYIENQLNTNLYPKIYNYGQRLNSYPKDDIKFSRRDSFFKDFDKKINFDKRKINALNGINFNGINFDRTGYNLSHKDSTENQKPFITLTPSLINFESSNTNLELSFKQYQEYHDYISDSLVYYTTIFDLSKQKSISFYSDTYEKVLLIHETPTQIIKNNGTTIKSFTTFSYEVDGEYYDASIINYRLVCEKMLKDIKPDLLKSQKLTGKEIMRIAGVELYNYDGIQSSLYDSNLDGTTDYKLSKVHYLIYTSTQSTSYQIFEMFMYGCFIAYFLFFTTSIIKYFNLHIYLTGIFISIIIYYIFLFINYYFVYDLSDTSSEYYTFVVSILVFLVLMICIKRAKRSVKIILYQIIVYLISFLLYLLYIALTNSKKTSYIEIKEAFYIYENSLNTTLVYSYGVATLIILLIIMTILSYNLHKIYAMPKSKS
ncbi:hypothetical protein IMCC3317_04840 [Kordia antarctica]|uniref:Uncharacterized protein n=1 Tax=Kordia antarctica TaxID=1218801 RepID=A0A7L4ZEI4_9FLAO|nr:hypothetical protein [Kordia antarctica]QHI35138.1 hypothetical protein IMCC3317_04840 [Kordia antarctica]